MCFFSRRSVGSGPEETALVAVKLLRGRKRYGRPSQTHGARSLRVHTRVRSDFVRQTVRLDSQRDQPQTVVHQGRFVSRGG